MFSFRMIVSLCLIISVVFAVDAQAEEQSKDMERKLASANNVVAIDLYRGLRSNTGNILFSPLSINSALALAYVGAAGETAKQMASVLHFPENKTEMNPAFRRFLAALSSGGATEGGVLSIANSLWPKKGLKLSEVYAKTAHDYYQAVVKPLDFAKKTEESRVEINKWVATQTKGKITDLFPPGSVAATTPLALANVVYFKGYWRTPFEKKDTELGTFYAPNAQKVDVSFMKQTGFYIYGETEELQILDLPYRGSGLVMTVFLPRARDGLRKLEEKFGAAFLEQAMAIMQGREVDVRLLRFKMAESLSLAESLRKLGLSSLFESSTDFSGMLAAPSKEPLFLGSAEHKAVIEVNEEGTEAAAATGFAMATGMPLPKAEFKTDHPFMFMIRDDSTGSILFMGRLNQPEE